MWNALINSQSPAQSKCKIMKVETNGQYQNKSAWNHKRVINSVSRAGFFDYFHVPTMKKLFSI